ncbi:hypothetical protein L2E82_48909 [Cichorium intybus]|uniref:Uncharacterized protein n=1 Tax=Cichorium intybus TaxID=13427 RepID=A0ACB8YY64_CICIN|nr:hypothetical protein L2E82_48909 [Cichorium intybus]
MCDGCSQISGREPVVSRNQRPIVVERWRKPILVDRWRKPTTGNGGGSMVRTGCSGASGLDRIGGVEYEGRDRCSGIAGWGWRQAMLGGGVEIFLGLGLTLFMGEHLVRNFKAEADTRVVSKLLTCHIGYVYIQWCKITQVFSLAAFGNNVVASPSDPPHWLIRIDLTESVIIDGLKMNRDVF